MSTEKRTPDTWVADVSRKYSNHARVNSSEKLICSVGNGENPDIFFEEWSNHARLIAAAPDLLEVVKDTLRLFRYNVEDAADAADFAAEVEMRIEAAIAKVEGKP